MAKPHLAHPTDPALTRCELQIVGPWPRPLPIVEAPTERTCRRCLRILAAIVVVEAAEEPFAPAGPEAPIYGARELSRSGRHAIERSRRGEAPAARGWSSAEAAVRSYVQGRAEGAPVRSTSDPDRAHRVQSSRDPSHGGRAHALVDRHRNVALALKRAALDVAALAHACPVLTAAECAEVYVLRVVGKAQRRPVRRGNEQTKGRVLEWLGRGGIETADEASERYGAAVTERHVQRIRRHFTDRVEAALVASGEMRAPTRAEREPRRWDPLRRLREDA